MMDRTKISVAIALCAAVTATVAVAVTASAAPAETDTDVLRGLAQVRQATAVYHDVDSALIDGYAATDNCVAAPGMGGMGYHYVSTQNVLDSVIDPLKPEILLYVPEKNGELKLAGVEYFAVDVGQERPTLLGVPFDGPMSGHEPGQPTHYDLHAWVWQANPAGIFAPFNPNVRC